MTRHHFTFKYGWRTRNAPICSDHVSYVRNWMGSGGRPLFAHRYSASGVRLCYKTFSLSRVRSSLHLRPPSPRHVAPDMILRLYAHGRPRTVFYLSALGTGERGNVLGNGLPQPDRVSGKLPEVAVASRPQFARISVIIGTCRPRRFGSIPPMSRDREAAKLTIQYGFNVDLSPTVDRVLQIGLP
jgi:hypothetical protein